MKVKWTGNQAKAGSVVTRHGKIDFKDGLAEVDPETAEKLVSDGTGCWQPESPAPVPVEPSPVAEAEKALEAVIEEPKKEEPKKEGFFSKIKGKKGK